jgi:hypothetical protein
VGRRFLTRDHRNLANLMTGCGVQQTREVLRGANRQGGEKPRRRNVSPMWQSVAEAYSATRTREWTRGIDVGGGGSLT